MRKSMLSKYLKLAVVTIAMSSLVLVGCGNSDKTENPGNGAVSDSSLPIATIEVKGMGTIKAELYPEIAPNTVNNFIDLSNKGYYDGLTFHRVIEDFMIQGGCPEGTGMGGPGYEIKGEFANNGFENELKHTEGVLSMARSGQLDSAGSQFFIMTETASHLDGDYAAFGKVIEGMDVVDKIEAVEKGANDAPVQTVEIKSIKVETNGKTYDEPEKI